MTTNYHFDKKIESKGEMKKQSERDENILQIERTDVESKTIDETNEECLEKEKIFIGSDALEESKTTEVKSKVKDQNTLELTVKDLDVSLGEEVLEKKTDWNSLYSEYVEGNEINVEDMVDLDTLYKEYVLYEESENDE